MNQPFDCTGEVGGHGLPFYTENAGRPSTPPDELYEEVDAALPFGKGYDKYWMLQVHFNNPGGVTGVQDTTGVEVSLPLPELFSSSSFNAICLSRKCAFLPFLCLPFQSSHLSLSLFLPLLF